MSRKPNVLVIGAGISGLMTAYRLLLNGHAVRVVDIGPDPRVELRRDLQTGATQSGLDARHISITETGPWTSPEHAELIRTPAASGGWLAIPPELLTTAERRWVSEFERIAADPQRHAANSALVFERNRRGMQLWQLLGQQHPELFKPKLRRLIRPA